jgi:hypothetical protein
MPSSMRMWRPSPMLNDRAARRDVLGLSTSRLLQAEPLFSEPEPLLVATRAISIPFGFNSPLILDVEQQTVAVSGPGACTVGQQVTLEVSIYQEQSGAMAEGQTEMACTGASGGWIITAMRRPGPLLATGPARACGVATTRDGETETDRQEWCRDLTLYIALYLPLIQTSERYTSIWESSGNPI